MNIIRDAARGLTIANNPANPGQQISINIIEIILEDANYQPLWIKGVSLTADLAHVGLNGLDAGTVTADSWYYVWLIAKQAGDNAALLSLSSDNPALPRGFTFKAFIGAVQTDSNSKLYGFSQIGHAVARNAIAVLNGGTAVAATAVDCSYAIPKRAIKAFGSFDLNPDSQQPNIGYGNAWLASKPQQGMIQFRGCLQPGKVWFSAPFYIPVVQSQTLYYQIAPNANTGSVTVSVSGFEF
jgi:hypothetical protein